MSFQDYEDLINRFVHDDDRLVTYKWLSRELKIHVNTAKDYLKEYWKAHKDKEQLVATFLLIGQLNDGLIKVQVVKEENLNSAKSLYKTITSEHFYSIQKILNDVDLLVGSKGDLKFSSIQNPKNDSESDVEASQSEKEERKAVGKRKDVVSKPVGCNPASNRQKNPQSTKKSSKYIRADASSVLDPMEVDVIDEEESKSDNRVSQKSISKSPSPVKNKNARKVSKMVAVDGDGHSVIKKVQIIETAEDVVDVVVIDKKNSPEPAKPKKPDKAEKVETLKRSKKSKKVVADGKKQTSIMSFFKKS